jgi:hypothetical protein
MLVDSVRNNHQGPGIRGMSMLVSLFSVNYCAAGGSDPICRKATTNTLQSSTVASYITVKPCGLPSEAHEPGEGRDGRSAVNP